MHKSTFQRPLNHGRAFVAVADAADVCDVEYSVECLRMVKAADFLCFWSLLSSDGDAPQESAVGVAVDGSVCFTCTPIVPKVN